MATPVIMPKFGMAQEEGTIIRWLKQEGERVEKGETILEVQTDKVDMEVEATASGILRDIRYGADATVPVTTVIAMIASEADEAASQPAKPLPPAPVAAPPPPSAPASAPALPQRPEHRATPVAQRMAQANGLRLETIAGSGPSGRIMRADVERAGSTQATPEQALSEGSGVRATPAARRLAREAALDLATIAGSGPNARVQAADVQQAMLAAETEHPATEHPAEAAAAPSVVDLHAATPGAAATVAGAPLRGVRRTIARRVVQSWSSIPHIYLTTTIDMTRAEALRSLLGPEIEALGEKLTPTILVAKAAAFALTRHPRLNAHLVEHQGELHLIEHAEVNLGLAVALAEGLVVPVVRDVASMGVAALAQQAGTLARRARANQLAPADIEGGTFTISSLGAYPVDHFTALIFPPQVAILAVGRMSTQPVWEDDRFVPRPLLEVTLSADHRAVDGAVAAAFLAEFKSVLERPERLLL